MSFRLELRDTSFAVIDVLDNEYQSLTWSYSRIGGCGEFSFKLPRKIFEQKSITGEQNVRIYYRNPATNAYDLWYQGLISNKTPNIRGNSESIGIDGHGYQAQLDRVYLNNITYTGQEVSVIVKNILDNYVVPNTNISYSAPNIEATSVTLDSIQFNDTAQSALAKLADIVGTREWGVDENRSLFFKARSSTVGLYFPLGFNITDFNENQDFSEIINRLIIQGAQSGGTYFTAGPYENLPSQLKYNIRTKVIQNSSISTVGVAQQYATAVFAEFSDVTRKSNFNLVNFTAQLEATSPMPLLNIIKQQVRYGQKKYGTFLYSGSVDRTINRINYSVSDNNVLKISLDSGSLRPTVAEKLAELEYNMEQQRSASL
jgi:hypothetical protein